ncbi:heme peroxidase [Artemisia annua]|uniref:Peroxidase n=1 Tax=Artemisia annua TaxID=35608 RepID=A0A2U1QD25_ARTAN|nr:heme peroxidase [Artemisia annua]
MAFLKASCLPTLIFVLLLCNIRASDAQTPPLAEGLSYTFHQSSCPQLESIVRSQLQTELAADIGQAAGLLRLHFHDCFVLGCDGSVLLNGSASGPSEQSAPPNLTLRPRAFVIIENIRSLVHAACNATVSCSDITALAARDAVVLSGGPNYSVPLGRRDGVSFASREDTLANLPPFNATAANLTASLALKGFDVTDVVALSGAHTIGRAECGSFERRMFPTPDPTMDQIFYTNLLQTCPILNTTNTTIMDIQTPNAFDNRYYVNLMNRQGLFTSDQDLFTDNTTSGIVTSFANNQTLFFENFVIAMIKMGQLNVTTGTQGEIRANCSFVNSNNTLSLPAMENANDNQKIASY